MNRLSLQTRARILGCLVEGNSLRATTRMIACSINTVTKLLVDLGTACGLYQNEVLRNLRCKRIQCDEIWSFCYKKQKNVHPWSKGVLGQGDVYTWTAIDPDTKLVPSWLVGQRSAFYAKKFINDLAGRLAMRPHGRLVVRPHGRLVVRPHGRLVVRPHGRLVVRPHGRLVVRPQVTTDGLKLYINAIDESFGADVDYAMLVKLYGDTHGNDQERRYSPAECCGTITGTVCGNPDENHISTSHVERQNLTMRMSMRRFTRLTNGFSKKIENHEHAVAIHYMYYKLRADSQNAAGYASDGSGRV